MKNNTLHQYAYALALFICIVLPLCIMGYKLQGLGYTLSSLIPAVSYRVALSLQVDGHGSDVQVSTYLPKTDARQTILLEQNAAEQFALALVADNLNRVATWSTDQLRGRQTLRYEYTVQAKHMRYLIPPGLRIPQSYPALFNAYLSAEDGVQVNDPLIQATLDSLFPSAKPDFHTALYTIHRYLQDRFANKNFSGFTDALTALKLGEASCNGKGRLFVALARKLNIPARLVGGLILSNGSKRTSHQWIEAYVNGHWVPFDTINDHFAEIPANFVALYYGDQVLFKHNPNINFQYTFSVNKRLMPRLDEQTTLKDSAFNIANLYGVFERVGISQNLLKILLMIPLGALVVVIARNVIGIETFGTFLPALIAAASRETGLLWGMLGFVTIILVVSLVRRLLDWFQLLHSPKMSILLTAVVIVMLALTVLGVQLELFELAHITLFPIAILAITAERFTIIEVEQGLKKAVTITFSTIVVIAASYAVMDSLFLQSMILAFPETLFLLIALNLWLGKWTGMRVSEFFRFRKLIFGTPS